jgi:transposase-like protein
LEGYAVEDRTSVTPALTGIFGPDLLTDGIRGKLKELIQVLLDSEVDEALDVARYARSEVRAGYRNGHKPRTIHTALGTVALEMPRARLRRAHGDVKEWQSQVLPRFERRSRSLDEALLSMYFAGANTRRIKRTLKPLLHEAPLGKNVISRLTARLSTHVEAWKGRSFKGKYYPYLYLDATNLKIRVFRQIRKVPILVALGVQENGQKEVLAMEPLVKESATAWSLVVEDLQARGLARPLLAVIDGNAGLRSALLSAWPGLDLQRCTVHKVRNLQDHCPTEAYPQVKEAYDRIVEAKNEAEARAAYQAFVRKWSKDLPSVVKSLEEAGDELLTFYRFPPEQWRSLKTTNPIERLNLEFKRRVKTQCSLPSEKSAITLLYGLLLSGQIRFRKINGADEMKGVLEKSKRGELMQKVS